MRVRRGVRTLLGSNEALEQLEHDQHLLRRHVDVLEQALAETARREASLRTLVGASNELLLEVGEDGRIRAASDSAEQLTGYTPQQIVGSHLTLWFHREDDALTRSFLSRVMNGDDTVVVDGLRARHERGDWLETALEARRCAPPHGERGVVIALREMPRQTHRDRSADLEIRLKRLEQRHQDLRELQKQLLEAERVAATRELADLMDRAVGTPLHMLVDELEALGHLGDQGPGDLAHLVDRARRLEGGLDRTLDTLRRAKVERTIYTVDRLVDEFESIIRTRLEALGIDLRVAADAGDGAVHGDPNLLGAALQHIAEHLGQHAAVGGGVEMEVGRCADRNALRIALWPNQDHGSGAPTDIPNEVAPSLDLELARGLLRAHGGDLTQREGAPCRTGLEITLPLAP
jgi:PAS domain S-box-containing protein